MIIDCIADLHGHYPELEGGDLLIVAGDLVKHGTANEYDYFQNWCLTQKYTQIIVIAGNHDVALINDPWLTSECVSFKYLCDSGTEFEGLKIWGSPWTPLFKGVNPQCTAFMLPEAELEAKFALIPDDTEILITHGPPLGVFDWNNQNMSCGSRSLVMRATSLPNLKLFAFGHLHGAYGMMDMAKVNEEIGVAFLNKKCKSYPIVTNCSHVNEHYDPVNKPIRILL